MAEWLYGLRNDSGAKLEIADIGLIFPTAGFVYDGADLEFHEISESDNLKTAVQAENVIVVEDGIDLSAADGIDFLKKGHKKYIDDQDDALSSSIGTTINALQGELDDTQSGAGLSDTGTYQQNGLANYIATATSLADADDKLDAQAKVNADNIATNATDIQTNADGLAAEITRATDAETDLGNELTATQAGAGLSAAGAYVAPTDSNYHNAATSLANADYLLDAAIKANADAIAALGGGSLPALQQEINDTQTGAGLEDDGSYSTDDTTNYLKAADFTAASVTPSLKGADKLLDAQIKVNADAVAANAAAIAQNVIDIANNATAIATNAGNITANANAISAETTRATAAEGALADAIDAVEAGAGLGTDGAYQQDAGANYIQTATSIHNATQLLDTALDATDTALAAETAARAAADLLLLPLDGSRTMTGDLDLGANQAFTTADPTTPNSLTRKSWVEMMVQGIAPKAQANVALSTPLPACTYDNGSAGFGATLTADANGALPTIDDITLDVGDSILPVGQVDKKQNGLYVVTQLGDAGTPWILTRRTDMDGSPSSEFLPGTSIPVNDGTTWKGYIFYLIGDAGVAKVPGTDDLEFGYVPGNAATSNLEAEVNAIETAMGINPDGTFILHSGSNYMDAAGNAFAARAALDTQLKTVADQVAQNVTDIASNLTKINTNTAAIADLQAATSDVTAIDGVPYAKDVGRSKWMGPVVNWGFGKDKDIKYRYLETVGGVMSNISSDKAHRALCITSLTCDLKEVGTCTVEIFKNDEAVAAGSLDVTAAAGNTRNDLDIALAVGDTIKVLVSSAAGVSSPRVNVVAAYTEAL